MNAETTPVTRESGEEGMLFVRTDGILETMVKAPLIIAGLIIVFLAMPLQSSFGSIRTLDLIINPDGSAHVYSEIAVESENLRVSLFGPSVDNLVAVGNDGSRLSGSITGDKAIFDPASSSSVTVTYDIHDLVSKEGRTWTFSFDSPAEYTLLMPENSVIVGMDVKLSKIEQIGGQIKLELAAGPSQIDYIFEIPPGPTAPAPQIPPFDLMTAGLIIGPIIAAAAGASIILKRRKPSPRPAVSQDQAETGPPDTETIFRLRPDMREDDKGIVKFIHENDGQVLESALRKKFLQPRTTMWRAVKRLERLGVVEIYKKDQQNMVKLRKELEDER